MTFLMNLMGCSSRSENAFIASISVTHKITEQQTNGFNARIFEIYNLEVDLSMFYDNRGEKF
ncbi:UNVERIFIED_CONTAM: hypothetical protein NCL1_10980 [Trichonephila clavipes]